ncbi:hypothetical protein JT318_gp67 [Pseudomonas phage PspYZU01]|uniref:Uncharacterized protein n=1 Tax=Pseudomonas phage PspYZU01 TaxID=1983555 RepID=A0A2U7NRW4_9CAUD|nr:hypothetical protein JT318_gp67 [Pseudomonas phage PspYZU01]ASD51952.1 hypothetical protein PspYZU01_67 [Pseudomonas phage PspYZU01]
MELNAVYTGNKTNLIGLHAKLRRCRGKTVYCDNPKCTVVFAVFDDPELPAEEARRGELTMEYQESEFAIEDPESPHAPAKLV